MNTRVFACLLVLSISGTATVESLAQTTNQLANSPHRLKEVLQKIGEGPQARVLITLNSGTKLKGYIIAVGDNSFDLADRTTQKNVTISFADVKEIKQQKPFRHTDDGVVPILAAVGIFLFAIVVYAISDRDG
jgi:hypothetical protein